ncbi:MAG: hypothetical protein H6807_02780 [Planctomycetes bacterium]|nr:hypothetical protein [Planctomycetota bacterium]
MSVIECKSCGGRFRLTALPDHGKLACPRCGVPMRTHNPSRNTTRSEPTANVTSEGGLRISGVVTRKRSGSRPIVVATICVLIIAVGAFVFMHF